MAGMTEAEIYAALGVEAPAAGNDQAGGEPEVQTDPAAAEAGQAAEETPREEPEDATAGEEDGGADGAQVPEDKPQQSQQERRENAARRRREEQQRAIDAALAEQKKQFDSQIADLFAKAGIKNTVTGEPITSMEQFDAYRSQHAQQKLERELKAGKPSKETIEQVIDERVANEVARQVEQQRREAEARARADADLAEIRKLDPKIQSAADLLHMDRAEQFADYVKRLNCSFLEAYRLTYFDRITENASRAAREQTARSIRSKDHLTGTVPGRGTGAVDVSPQEMAYYRAFLPNASDAEIQAFHNKHSKK